MAREVLRTYTYTCDYPDCGEKLITDNPQMTDVLGGELPDGKWLEISTPYGDERHYCNNHGREALIFLPKVTETARPGELRTVPRLSNLWPYSPTN